MNTQGYYFCLPHFRIIAVFLDFLNFRTKTTDWSFIRKSLLQMIFTIFMMTLIFEKFAESFENVCKEKTTYPKLLLAIWQHSFYGLMCLIGFGFIALHCWLNVFSELLRFGDRLFHKVLFLALNSILSYYIEFCSLKFLLYFFFLITLYL